MSKLKQQFKQGFKNWMKSELINDNETEITVEDVKDAQSYIISRNRKLSQLRQIVNQK